MQDILLYEKANIPDQNFPIRISYNVYPSSSVAFYKHWHEQLELLYFIKGEACVECNSTPLHAVPGDLIVVNTNELHYCYSYNQPLEYYCIIIDPSFFKSNFYDTCEIKYITPIQQNMILFKNKVSNDPLVDDCIRNIIEENTKKELGFELAIKSHINWLLVLLLRNHLLTILTSREHLRRDKNLTRLNLVLKYIDDHYTEDLSADFLSDKICLSRFHFSHLFKSTTGRTLTEYINQVRINKAEVLLKNSNMSISEIASASGFNDINYFSRVFKRLKNIPPSKFNVKND